MRALARTIYRCDFCSKHRLTKAAAARHEQYCKHNPNNQHRCFGCQNLQVTDGKSPEGSNCKQFTCQAFERRLYTYVAEKRNLNWAHIIGPDAMRMPLECPAYAPEVYEPTNEPAF